MVKQLMDRPERCTCPSCQSIGSYNQSVIDAIKSRAMRDSCIGIASLVIAFAVLWAALSIPTISTP